MSWARCCRSIKTRYEFVSKQLTTYPQCVPHTNTAGATRRVKCVTIDKHKLNIVVSKLLLNLREKLNDCRREPYESSSHILHTEKHYPLLTIHGWMTTDNVCVLRSVRSLVPKTRFSVHRQQLRSSNKLSLFKCNTDRFKCSFFPALTQYINDLSK